MKILIFIPSLTAGGAEKVASMMANYWCDYHAVTLLTNTAVHNDFFEIDPRVKRRATGYVGAPKTNIVYKTISHIKGLYQLRHVIKEEAPDIIISHMDVNNVRVLLATCYLNIPVIIEEHNNPQLARKMPQPWRSLQQFAYRKFADRIVLLTRDLLPSYPQELHHKIVYIPNPLVIPAEIPDSNEVVLKQPSIVSMGSLRKIKGFDLLIEAFASVVKQHPEWHLTILGEGGERESLHALIESFNLQGKVDMPGRVSAPYGVIKNADIYVLSSRSEAFPVALCEAMGVGLPCVSFDCPTGPSDIIEDGVNGFLVEYLNVEKLSEAMIRLIENDKLRQSFSHEALKINETLNIDSIMGKWDRVISETNQIEMEVP